MPAAQHHEPSSPSANFVESVLDEQLDRLETALRKHPRVVLGVGATAVVGVGFLLYALRARRRRTQRREAIVNFAARLLGAPSPAETEPKRSGAIKQSVKNAGGALLSAAGRELGRRAVLAVTHPVTDVRYEEEHAPG